MQNICKLYAFSLFPIPSHLLGLWQWLLCWKSTERRKAVEAFSPFPGLSGSLLVLRSQKPSGSGHRQDFHGTGAVLGSRKDNLATVLASSSDRACPGCRGLWSVTRELPQCLQVSVAPQELLLSFPPISSPPGLGLWSNVELGSCEGSACASAAAGYRREAGA